MPKPTLLQTLFNKPSQSYSSASTRSARPPLEAKYFHSVRDEMLKLAASESKAESFSPKSRILPVVKVSNDDSVDSEHDDSEDVFYTPNTSPRVSVNGEQHQSEGYFGHRDVIANFGPKDAPCLSSSHLSSRAPSPASSSVYSLGSTSTAGASTSYSRLSFSDAASPATTRATTPAESDREFCDKEVHDATVSRSTSPSSSTRRRKRERRHQQDNWSKDVRWLVSPEDIRKPSSSSTTSSSNLRRAQSTRDASPASSMLQTLTPTAIPNHIPVGHRRSKTISSHSTSRRSLARRRMSAVWEEDEGGSVVDTVPSPRPTSPRLTKVDRQPRPPRANTISAPRGASPRVRPPSLFSEGSQISTQSTASKYTTASRFVELPVPLPVSDGGTPAGFTSLVLPRAAYTPRHSKRYSVIFGGGNDSSAMLSQTTMSTISITKNAAGASPTSRPRLFSLSSFTHSSQEKQASLKATASTLVLSDLPVPLSLTSHSPPPSKVGSQQALVKVYAVGLDHLDDLIVREKVGRTDCYGFVPGRSFVGRIVECGYEMNNFAKGEWVFGLLDVRKCGALSEFVVVDKRRLTVCPRPSPKLTLEQLALLPLCGTPAHRAVRTFEDTRRGANALVLEGHDGAGALAVQELASHGVRVTVQVTPEEIKDREKSDQWVRQVDERLRLWGAKEVHFDSPTVVISTLHENAYDFVLDTVGGRRIWDACRRVLVTTGQFTTLVGEAGDAVPSAAAHYRANRRSIWRTFVKKEHKALGYAWVSPALDLDSDGEDVRDSLARVAKLASDGVLGPLVEAVRCVPFERTPRLFASAAAGRRDTLGQGRTAVVRIVD